MAQRTLVERDLRAGEETVRALDAAGLPIDAALWLYEREGDRWLFVVATPLREQVGPLRAYEAIEEALKPFPDALGLFDITAMSPNDPVIRSLHDEAKLVSSVMPRRFAGSRIEEAFIYRVAS